MEQAADRLKLVLERIERAAVRAGRRPKDITLLAVTKTVPLEKILPFLQAGVRHVGENRVQEALAKYSSFPLTVAAGDDVHPIFHLIGPLQSNKAKKAVERFNLIQTLDRWDLAADLDRHAGAQEKIQECLIQVKISDEASKSGLDPAALPEFLNRVKTLPHLRIRGVMGIPPLTAMGDSARPYFKHLRRLFEESKLDILSMGMSSDFETAIEEGSTLVRVGTALFGSRA